MKQAPIVLTADESMMSDFGKRLYYGYAACFPTGFFTKSRFKTFCPSVKCHSDGRVKLAPLSLRMVESILHRCGFNENEYVTIHPTHLGHFIGPKTKIVGVSAIDPRGLGPVSTTICSLSGGIPYSSELFTDLLNKIKALKERYAFSVVVGGPGAWQLADEEMLDEYGIDYLVMGEAESVIPELFTKLVHDNDVYPLRIIIGKAPRVEEIPPILHATTNGLIEASRGCGRGCAWCSSSVAGVMRCIPIDVIKKSAEVNVRSKMADTLLQSDDILLYGSKSRKFIPDPDAVLTLLNELYSINGIRNVSFLHFSFASIVASPNIIPKITNLLKGHECTRFEVQIGIETGSPLLIEKYMRGKALPFTPDEWSNIVREAAQILRENRWFCYATLILGLPGESAEDIIETIKLVKELRDYPLVIMPLLFVPVTTTQFREYKCFSYKNMLKEHTLLLHEVLKHNEGLASRDRGMSMLSILSSFYRLVLNARIPFRYSVAR